MRESQKVSLFHLEKTNQKLFVMTLMWAILKSLVHRPSVRFGLRRDGRGRFRDPRFVSFISQTNRKALNTDIADALLQGRRFVRVGLTVALVGGCAWVLIESAKALSMF